MKSRSRVRPAAARRVPFWDAAVRLLHWALALLVLFAFLRDDGDWWHRAGGYAAVVLVAARLLWGAAARGNARLAAMQPSPRATRRYLQLLRRGRAPRQAGHDPLALWMVWLLWTLVLLLGLTGWMSRLDMFWGDERIQLLHAWIANGLLAAVALHLTGVAAMSWLWRENLPAAMVTGRKRELEGNALDPTDSTATRASINPAGAPPPTARQAAPALPACGQRAAVRRRQPAAAALRTPPAAR